MLGDLDYEIGPLLWLGQVGTEIKTKLSHLVS